MCSDTDYNDNEFLAISPKYKIIDKSFDQDLCKMLAISKGFHKPWIIKKSILTNDGYCIVDKRILIK